MDKILPLKKEHQEDRKVGVASCTYSTLVVFSNAPHLYKFDKIEYRCDEGQVVTILQR